MHSACSRKWHSREAFELPCLLFRQSIEVNVEKHFYGGNALYNAISNTSKCTYNDAAKLLCAKRGGKKYISIETVTATTMSPQNFSWQVERNAKRPVVVTSSTIGWIRRDCTLFSVVYVCWIEAENPLPFKIRNFLQIVLTFFFNLKLICRRLRHCVHDV